MKNFKLWVFLLAAPLTAMGQDLKETDLIPFDPSVKTGKLENGLTYYIKRNTLPEDKVDLRLVINAGSILEDDDQQGLAHFMEHMCFNGTKRFPKNALVDYLQSIGVKFGQHLNAYTSFDETVYFLPIPSDSPEKLEKGFEILEDWAFNTVLTPEEIDKERGVVLEEYRIGLGADNRMMKQFMPKMMYKSHYADRLPIGQKEILENFTPDKIKRFYKDWYRPNLMAVIVVGDIDVAEMEKKVKEHFAAYKNPENERPRKVFDVPNHDQTFVCVESDKEATSSSVRLIYKDYEEPKKEVTVGDYKKYLKEYLFTVMLNQRLREYQNKPNPPFVFGYTMHSSTWARTKEAYQSSAISVEGKQLEALKILVQENARAKKYGFSTGELERAKKQGLIYTEKSYNDRDKTESASFVSQYQNHFLEGYPAPGIEWKYNAMTVLFNEISAEDINGVVDTYIKEDNRVVIFTGPEKEGLQKPDEKDILAVLDMETESITPYEDGEVVTGLLRNEIQPGWIVKKESNSRIGTTTLFLSNGAKVVYKKTDFKNDEVLMRAVSFGGNNLYSNEEIKKTNYAYGGLFEAGYSGLDLNEINKFMIGKIAYASPFISDITEGFRGSATPQDMEYMFQMTYAYFTDLNLDKEAFEHYKEKEKAFFANVASRPSTYFAEVLYEYMQKDDPRYIKMFADDEGWKNTDYELAYKKYKERFASAGDFVFYLVGNIDDKKIEEYAAKYLASLPAKSTPDKVVDLESKRIKGDHKKIIYKGSDPKSEVRIYYYGETKYSEKEALSLKALGEILTIKLVEELRENESGVYGIRARGNMEKMPHGRYNFSIFFPCGPDNAEKLTASALAELKKIIEKGPEGRDLAKFKEAELLDYKQDIKDNKFWLSYLEDSYVNSTNPESILEIESKINEVTAKDIQKVAKKYLSGDKVIGILMPEGSK